MRRCRCARPRARGSRRTGGSVIDPDDRKIGRSVRVVAAVHVREVQAHGGPDIQLGEAGEARPEIRPVAPLAGADQELPDLAAEAEGVGDDRVEVDIGRHPVERAAERDQGAVVVGDLRVLRVVDHRAGMGQLTPDLEERREIDRGPLPHRAAEQRALDAGIEVGLAVDDVGDELPAARRREGVVGRLRLEVVEQLGTHLDEEQDLGGDPGAGGPGAPVVGVDADVEMHEAVGERRRHAVHDRAILLAVAVPPS